MTAISIFLLVCVLISPGQGILEMEQLIPSDNWYSPSVYPISRIPADVDYSFRSCSIIESFLWMMLDGYRNREIIDSSAVDRSMDAFWSCRQTICDNTELVDKLTEPLVAAEFASVMMTLGKEFENPGYEVFQYVVDPFYWEILKDVSYPVVEEEHFVDQNNAAFEIISKVCGHQKATLKAEIFPEVVNKIFLDILIDEYIPNSISESEKTELASETDTDKLRVKWSNAQGFRQISGVCLDSALTSSEERKSVSRIRKIAEELGIECGAAEEDEIDIGIIDYGSFGSAPGSSIGGGGAAPGSSTGAAWAQPPSSGISSSFVPGR